MNLAGQRHAGLIRDATRHTTANTRSTAKASHVQTEGSRDVHAGPPALAARCARRSARSSCFLGLEAAACRSWRSNVSRSV